MATAVSMPKLGMTMEEGTLLEWCRAPGDPVEKGDVIAVIESEKNEADIEAAASGTFRHAYLEPGETVPCGTLLGAITATPDEAFDAAEFKSAEDRPESKATGGLQVRTPSAPSPAPAASTAGAARKPVAPAARSAAKALGIDPQEVDGTGPGGRVTREDVEARAAAREALVSVTDGVSLEVVAAGDGEPVVLLPGLGTDVSVFARQTPWLEPRFRVLGVNPRGVGHSDAPEQPRYAPGEAASDAAATFEGAAHVIGASLGAAAAIELAIQFPDRVKSLTLITPFTEVDPRLTAVADGWRRLASEASPETMAAALLPWFFSPSFLADEGARTRTVRGLAQTVARVPGSTLERSIAGMHEWSGSRTGALSGITVPTLVVAAGGDLLTPNAAGVAKAIPGASLCEIADAGHAVALEAHEAVQAALEGHLG